MQLAGGWVRWMAAGFVLGVVACGDDDGAAVTPDASSSTDVGARDLAREDDDAGTDASEEDARPPVDARTPVDSGDTIDGAADRDVGTDVDAGAEAGLDASRDAAMDAAPEADATTMSDAAMTDGGSDAGPSDAGPMDAGPSTGPSLVDPDVRIELVRYAGVLAEAASITPRVGATPMPGIVVLNVVADLDGDGTIAAYPVGASMQEEWVVQNVSALTIDRPFSYAFAAIDPMLAESARVPIRVTVGDAPLVAAPALAYVDGDGSRRIDAAVSLREVATAFVPPTGDSFGGGGLVASDEWTTESERDIDHPDFFYRNGQPDGPGQQQNGCVSAGIASGLTVLASRDGWSDALRESFTTESFPLTTNAGVDALAQHLNVRAMWGYDPASGVLPPNILPGKERVVRELGLPVTTRVTMVVEGTDPFDTIATSLRDGCVVELGLSLPRLARPPLFRVPGHFVAVAGFARGSSTLSRYLIIRDNNTETLNDTVGLRSDGTVQQFRLGETIEPASISYVMTECTDLTFAVRLAFPHGDLPAGAVVPIWCITSGSNADAHPGVCDCEHWHGDMSIIGHGGPYADAPACGHGCFERVHPRDVTVHCPMP